MGNGQWDAAELLWAIDEETNSRKWAMGDGTQRSGDREEARKIRAKSEKMGNGKWAMGDR